MPEPSGPGIYVQMTPTTTMCVACGIAWTSGDDEVHDPECVISKLTRERVRNSHLDADLAEARALIQRALKSLEGLMREYQRSDGWARSKNDEHEAEYHTQQFMNNDATVTAARAYLARTEAPQGEGTP